MNKPWTPDELPIIDLDWRSLLPVIGKANAALARYDGMLQTLPNPAVLLSPMTANEAVLSSRIEGTRATLDEVLEFEAGVGNPDAHATDIEEFPITGQRCRSPRQPWKNALCARLAAFNNRITANGMLRQLDAGGLIKIVREGLGRRAAVYAMPQLINIAEGRAVL